MTSKTGIFFVLIAFVKYIKYLQYEANILKIDSKKPVFHLAVHKIYLQEEMKERNKNGNRRSRRTASDVKAEKFIFFYFCFFIASGHTKVCMKDVRGKKKKNSEQG